VRGCIERDTAAGRANPGTPPRPWQRRGCGGTYGSPGGFPVSYSFPVSRGVYRTRYAYRQRHSGGAGRRGRGRGECECIALDTPLPVSGIFECYSECDRFHYSLVLDLSRLAKVTTMRLYKKSGPRVALLRRKHVCMLPQHYEKYL
jgi:hypothetical protein